MSLSKNQEVISLPPEWSLHQSVWLAWPCAANLWEENLAPAQKEFSALCKAICDQDPKTGQFYGESLNILVPNDKEQKKAEIELGSLPIQYHHIPFGDIWLRDTAPIFAKNSLLQNVSLQFQFNGWGHKYNLPHDNEVAKNIAEACHLPSLAVPFVLEGGSIEVDGEGTCMTTEQCLMNPNRNPQFNHEEIEHKLKNTLGFQKIIWIKEGLLNDHTDGHIDTLARFVKPGTLVCMKSQTTDDPNYQVLEEISSLLKKSKDAKGRPFEVIEIPSPGKVLDDNGDIMPASFVNFYISNTSVIVPIYGTPYDHIAVEKIGQLFPTRKTVGLYAKSILSGGGAFHCITQQQPV